MTDALDDDLRFVHLLADAADAITRAAFTPGTSLEHDLKDDGTPVSETDRAVEQALLAHVQAHRPDDAFLGEEVGAHGSSRRCWVVDGVDGTNNFVAGDPRWGTLIALVEDDVPVVGLNTGPAQRRRWWAARGGGAWTAELDPRRGTARAEPLQVAAPPADPPRACLELAWEGHPTRATVDRLSGKVRQVPMSTHAGLLVASGEADLAVHVAGGPWDVAAVMLIVSEAGGRCVDLAGADVDAPRPPVVYLGGLQPAELRHLLAA
jgi:histidinol-phosphatase